MAIDDDDMFAECEEQGKMKKRKFFRIYWKTMKGKIIFCGTVEKFSDKINFCGILDIGLGVGNGDQGYGADQTSFDNF